jgi:hypothetical protein
MNACPATKEIGLGATYKVYTRASQNRGKLVSLRSHKLSQQKQARAGERG